ncbi:MAG: type II toxin-antitoxin system RelE/ParE family toxin [Dehalococcoidia bacterium]|nr:type II toxin-antitoxin system RelE/ParE family toxin [Dehalococcoidia bacterium]
MHEVAYEPRAERELLALPRDVARRVAAAIDRLSEEPRPSGCRKLSSRRERLYRIRVGDYRVIYEVRDNELVIIVIQVAKRDEATYRGL